MTIDEARKLQPGDMVVIPDHGKLQIGQRLSFKKASVLVFGGAVPIKKAIFCCSNGFSSYGLWAYQVEHADGPW